MKIVIRLLLALSLLVVGCGAENSNVVVLTDNSFASVVTVESKVLVEFYAPWCGHCQRLLPEFEAAAAELKLKSDVVLAKVDCDAETELATQYGISGYPTIIFFNKSKRVDYTGGTTSGEIVQWVLRLSGPDVRDVENENGVLAELESSSPVAFLYKTKTKTMSDTDVFAKFARENRPTAKFFRMVDENRVNKDEVVALSIYDDPVSIDEITMESLAKLVEDESLPTFGPVSVKNYELYLNRGFDMMWYCSSKEDYDANVNAIKAVAKKYRQKISFVFLDISLYVDHAKHRLAITDFPSFALEIKGGGRFVHYDNRTSWKDNIEVAEAFEGFIEKAYAGQLEQSLKSEEIPAPSDDPVEVVVGKNFKEKVFHSDKDVLLEVYASWCGHCQQFKPEYEKFATMMKPVQHIVVAKMDGFSNESPSSQFHWTGFPTIFFIKAGTETPILFDDARTVEGLLNFLKKHSSKPIPDVLLSESTTPDTEL